MVSRQWLEEIKSRARSALSKPAQYGEDIDLGSFSEAVGEGVLDLERAGEVGFNPSSRAYYIQVDQNYIKYLSRFSGVEIMSIREFVENRPDEARDYYWRLVDPGQDKYTAIAALLERGGYYIRVKKNTRVEDPIMACLFLSTRGIQAPHNIVIAEKGSEVIVWTGCTIAPEVIGLHVGISEFYIEERAKLTFIMIHAWNRASHVRPRTGVLVGEDGYYLNYYANLSSVKTLQAYPVVILKEGARAGLYSVILGSGESSIDYGGLVYLDGEESSAEVVSKALARDRAKVITRGRLHGRGRGARGHLECRGLMLSGESFMLAIPELSSETMEASLTHEASIGRLAEEEINYLVSKGFTRDEAVGLLVKGFVSIDERIFPAKVRSVISSVEKLLVEKSV
ncbi:SufB/SufD family protein [Thermogladius sp. 4427co]|uniref:SufB/SufD family protein n=1 Tax=Thermogladius sp. 4427co TaxID=3450718 RepID=UPI003F78EB0B